MHLKSLLLLIILLCTALLPTHAQQPTVRQGNTYLVGTEVMNKKAYEGYLKNTCPDAFSQFHTGRKLSNVGWGLFGGGLAIESLGIGFMSYALNGNSGNAGEDFFRAAFGGPMAFVVVAGGVAVTGASVALLSVGYKKMHKAADLYNMQCTTQPTAYLTTGLSLNSTAPGLSLTLHF